MAPIELLGGRISRGQLRQQVTSRILAAVFQGRFRPGEHLVVQPLAAALDVSSTPVREALLELASLGIVDLLPNRGAVVRPFGPREVREISQIRRVLETEAARCACARIADGPLAELERELMRLQAMPSKPEHAGAARAVDTRLHGLIAESCDSHRLKAEIDRYVGLWLTLRDVSQQRDDRTFDAHITASLEEHLAIVRALRAGDAEASARGMDRHIRGAGRILEEVLFGDRSDGGPSGVTPPVPR